MVISTSATIFRPNVATKESFEHCGFEKLPDSSERAKTHVLCFFVQVKLMFGSCSLTSGCSPNRPENKEAAQNHNCCKAFGSKYRKILQDRCDVPDCYCEKLQAESINSTTCVRPWQSIKSLAENTSLFLGPESKKLGG